MNATAQVNVSEQANAAATVLPYIDDDHIHVGTVWRVLETDESCNTNELVKAIADLIVTIRDGKNDAEVLARAYAVEGEFRSLATGVAELADLEYPE